MCMVKLLLNIKFSEATFALFNLSSALTMILLPLLYKVFIAGSRKGRRIEKERTERGLQWTLWGRRGEERSDR